MRQNLQIGLGLALAIGAELSAWTLHERHWLTFALALGAIAIAGRDTLRHALLALRSRQITISTLMSIAVLGALLIGHWSEAAMVIVLFALAELLEERAAERAHRALESLLALVPPVALAQTESGEWQTLPVEQVRVGMRVRVRPGERIPFDGTVVAGASAVDESPITGESLPVEKSEGDTVYAGSLNQHGALELVVTAPRGHTLVDQIVRLMQQAQAERAPIERFVDRFARAYTPAVVLLALLVTLLLPLFGIGWGESLYRGLALLVIACPCALVISTPVTLVSGLTVAARRGVLIKGGAALEVGARMKALALDKTGTLTLGKPKVVEVLSLDEQLPEVHLHRAAQLSAHSEHPLAQAILQAWQDSHLQPPAALKEGMLREFQALPGRGMLATLDGQTVGLGNHRLIEERGLCSKSLEAILERVERDGKTAVVLFDRQPRAVIALQDVPRPEAASALNALRQLGLHLVLLTGDNAPTARAVAQQLHIEEVYAELLPAEKQAIV
ncbi:MAG: cation-translocating P-type ATPase, partial [Fimbriimonadales bacterium]|nr:cation-translocating P-type ATPase [Fimbriimonadales bacterium]